MPNRREFLQASGLSLAYAVGAQTLSLSPAQAYAKQLPYKRLSKAEAATLELLADSIVPGARTAGVAHYLDAQLAATAEDCLLMIKYLGVPSPYDSFYQAALQAADQLSQSEYKKPWPELSDTQREALTDQIASGAVTDWQGPPAGFFFFVLRADASDVVYGTERGHAAIDFPHMAHIKPVQEW
ncbi:MAG: gluconate 2-dehydrogenase subunit 3 family protein [Pseudomonadales bacterium]